MTRPSDARFTLPVRIIVREDGETRTLTHDGSRTLTIGRAEDSDIVLATTRASRNHAEIIGEGGRFTLIDPGSSNGTRIRGEKVSKHALRPGDEIEIGEARIAFGEPARVERPARPRAAARPGAPDEAAERPATPVRTISAAPAGRSPFAMVDALLVVLLILLLGLITREYMTGNDPRVAGGPGTTDEGARPTAEETVTGTEAAPAPEREFRTPGVFDADAADSLTIVEGRIADGESRYDALEDLREIGRLHSGSAASTRARRLVTVLEGLRRTEAAVRRERAERALAPLVGAERYGDALVVLDFLGRLEEDPAARERWRERATELERTAERRLRVVEDELSALLDAGLADEALRALVGVRDRFGGVPAFEETLPRFVEAGLGTVPTVARGEAAPPELIQLDAAATRAFAECRYADLVPIHHRALGLDLPSDERVRQLEGLVEAHYLQAMWEEFIEGIGGGEVRIDLSKDYTGRIVRADEHEVEIEREIAGGKMLDRRPWARLNPVARFALFSAVQHERDGQLGLAFLARRGGDPENFDRALLTLHRRAAGRELAEAVLARHRGESVPESGYVEHAGRLMTPVENEAEIAHAKELRRQEREAIEELKRIEKSAKVDDVIAWVHVLRSQGSFSLADRVLREVVAKTDETMGAEARRLLEDPVLGSVPLRESGPAERRIDFFILGDGYLVQDEYQESFLNAARSCEKILFSVDPYREYQSYFNVAALHLQSKEAGADRIPGDVEKDTACDAVVTWQRLTCNPEKVFSYIRRFPEAMARDHQGVVIVNDYADVATGGGGVATLSKAALALVQHEVGHSFGTLLDEYDYTPGTDPDRPMPEGRKGNVPVAELRPNLMQGSDREAVLADTYWRNWIEAGEEAWWNHSKVSVFEGGNHQPFEVWRPQSGCMMRDNSGFCVVCMETMVKQIYRRVRPIDRLEPEAGRVTIEAGDETVFHVIPMQPRTHALEVTWRLVDLGVNEPGESTGRTAVKEAEGEVYRRAATRTDVDGRTVHGAQIRAADLRPGWYRLKVEVRDRTPWVIDDPDELLVDRADWLIQVLAKE